MKRAVVMIVDGLRADMVTQEHAPVLARTAESSRVYRRHRSVFPSATRVNSASIATGCLPGRHGLHGNAICLDEGGGLTPVSVGPPEFRERWRRATGRTLHVPTLAERLSERGGAVVYSNSSAGAAHMQDPDGHGTLYHRSGSHEPGFAPVTGAAHPDVAYDASGDAEVTTRTCAALADPGETELFVLWICEPDHSQHTLELGSHEHREVIAESDRRVGEVAAAVEAMRARGDDVLLAIGSDHGHESVDEIIPVGDLLVEAGLKESAQSTDVAYASSGMGALVYLAPDAADREPAIAGWLRAQPWIGEAFGSHELDRVGLRREGSLAIAFSMGKRDASNRFGIPGHGHVAGDPFMKTDHSGHGQHGGLGRWETNPFLIVSGAGFRPGVSLAATSTVDIAPTVLAHLGAPHEDMDGRPLPRS